MLLLQFATLIFVKAVESGYISYPQSHRNPADVTYLSGPAPQHLLAGPAGYTHQTYSAPVVSAPAVRTYQTYSAPVVSTHQTYSAPVVSAQPNYAYSTGVHYANTYQPIQYPVKQVIPVNTYTIHQSHSVPVFRQHSTQTQVVNHSTAQTIGPEAKAAAQTVFKKRKYQVRRPAIQNHFYDVEERIIIRPVGSALVELEHPISKTETTSQITSKAQASVVVQPSSGTITSNQQASHDTVVQTGNQKSQSGFAVVHSTPSPFVIHESSNQQYHHQHSTASPIIIHDQGYGGQLKQSNQGFVHHVYPTSTAFPVIVQQNNPGFGGHNNQQYNHGFLLQSFPTSTPSSIIIQNQGSVGQFKQESNQDFGKQSFTTSTASPYPFKQQSNQGFVAQQFPTSTQQSSIIDHNQGAGQVQHQSNQGFVQQSFPTSTAIPVIVQQNNQGFGGQFKQQSNQVFVDQQQSTNTNNQGSFGQFSQQSNQGFIGQRVTPQSHLFIYPQSTPYPFIGQPHYNQGFVGGFKQQSNQGFPNQTPNNVQQQNQGFQQQSGFQQQNNQGFQQSSQGFKEQSLPQSTMTPIRVPDCEHADRQSLQGSVTQSQQDGFTQPETTPTAVLVPQPNQQFIQDFVALQQQSQQSIQDPTEETDRIPTTSSRITTTTQNYVEQTEQSQASTEQSNVQPTTSPMAPMETTIDPLDQILQDFLNEQSAPPQTRFQQEDDRNSNQQNNQVQSSVNQQSQNQVPSTSSITNRNSAQISQQETQQNWHQQQLEQQKQQQQQQLEQLQQQQQLQQQHQEQQQMQQQQQHQQLQQLQQQQQQQIEQHQHQLRQQQFPSNQKSQGYVIVQPHSKASFTFHQKSHPVQPQQSHSNYVVQPQLIEVPVTPKSPEQSHQNYVVQPHLVQVPIQQSHFARYPAQQNYIVQPQLVQVPLQSTGFVSHAYNPLYVSQSHQQRQDYLPITPHPHTTPYLPTTPTPTTPTPTTTTETNYHDASTYHPDSSTSPAPPLNDSPNFDYDYDSIVVEAKSGAKDRNTSEKPQNDDGIQRGDIAISYSTAKTENTSPKMLLKEVQSASLIQSRSQGISVENENQSSTPIIIKSRLSAAEARSNQDKFIQLLSERDGITEIGVGKDVDHSRSIINSFVRSRVLSATPAPRGAKETSRTVNIRRVIVSSPTETLQEIEVNEPYNGNGQDKYLITQQQENNEVPVYVKSVPPAFSNDHK